VEQQFQDPLVVYRCAAARRAMPGAAYVWKRVQVLQRMVVPLIFAQVQPPVLMVLVGAFRSKAATRVVALVMLIFSLVQDRTLVLSKCFLLRT
jgi:hypothetical protein